MNNHKELTLEERLSKLQKIKIKKEKKYAEISAQIRSAEKKSKNTTTIDEKICNQKRIEREIKSIKNEITLIRKEINKRQEKCIIEGHDYITIYHKESSIGTSVLRQCKICGTVESEFIRNEQLDSPRLAYKPGYKQAE